MHQRPGQQNRIGQGSIGIEDLCPGIAVLYCDRLATIMHAESHVNGAAAIVEVVDAGGLARRFTVDVAHLYPVTSFRDPNTASSRTAVALFPGRRELRKRAAEVWFANPRTGDVFHMLEELLVEVIDVGILGPITVLVHRHNVEEDTWSTEQLVFNNAAAFREEYQRHGKPGYWLSAGQSKRSTSNISLNSAKFSSSPLSTRADT